MRFHKHRTAAFPTTSTRYHQIGVLNRFTTIGSRHGMLELSRASLETYVILAWAKKNGLFSRIFDVCDELSRARPDATELREAATVMIELVRVLLARFIDDDIQSGQCPLPRQRLEEMGFVLERLRRLRLPQGALRNGAPPQQHDVLTRLAGTLVASLFNGSQTGTRSHIVLLLPDLLKLVVAKDGYHCGVPIAWILSLLRDVGLSARSSKVSWKKA